MKPKTPKTPNYFSPKAANIWRRVHQEYELEPDASELLRVSLENMDLGDTAREKLRSDGPVLPNGRKNPALDGAKLFDGMFMRGMKQLGLDVVAQGTPAGRRV